MPSRPPAIHRRQRLLELIAEGPASADNLRQRLRPTTSVRTLAGDLAWLLQTFPSQMRRTRGGDARIVLWSLVGLPPVLLTTAITALTHDELAALIAARGLLRSPETRQPGWERPSSPYAGDLSAAVHGLLERSGLTEEARQIAPGTVGVSRFGIAPEAPGSIAILQRALRTGQAVYFSYRNRHSVDHPSHVWPIRLVMIKGEWFCFAWAPSDGKGTGRVKQYALSRITSRDPAVSIADRLPLGAPIRQPHDEVDAILASGFHATGSVKPQDRSRVVLAVSPEAWPSIANRTWGEHQLIDTGPEDLPPGWRRLTFSTTGLPEARHWVASFGSFVRPEGPPELMFWLKNEAERVASILAHMPAKQPAQISDTVIP